MTVFEAIFSAFLAAHVAGDFLLQSEKDVANKSNPAVLAKHAAVHGLLTIILIGAWTAWLPALGIALGHAAIDFAKRRLSNGGWRAFLVDQAAHLAVLAVAAGLYAHVGVLEASYWGGLVNMSYYRALAVLAGLVVSVQAGAYFVDLAVDPFLAQISADRTPPPAGPDASTPFAATERAAGARLRGLRDGGRTIGQLERALIFVFVLIHQFSAIGFLIAAKSIFRFGELRERANRMEAEYIIIGTLISFLWAIVAALLTRLLAGL